MRVNATEEGQMLFDPRTELDVVGKILMDAAFHLEEHGWRRGFPYGDAVCVRDAINIYAPDRMTSLLAIERLQRFLGAGNVVNWYLTTWNDFECRDGEEAADALRGAAVDRRP
jgi:hypothetical protein